ncbi:MAG: serine/threonine-protein kinase, partial [Planctomycetota bacterium]|nr:serine/threonine-protein kinase [Planctomycetota bacterium]
MSKQTDDLQAQWILLSNWLEPDVLARARAEFQPSASKDLCDHLFEQHFLSPDQVQQIRYAVQVQESKVQDQFQRPRLSDRLRKELSPDHTEDFVGQYLGRGQYKILEEVSRGGMGVVFKATQLAWNKTVAIKLLLDSHLNDQGIQRFQREIDILSSLDHPNIAKILGHGIEEEQPFFVMEFIAGPTFEEVVEQHVNEHSVPPESDEISRILGSVANALNYTHSNDLIHRDVKPANILISETHEHAVLVDFGLVKEENPASSAAFRLSKSGEILGTLAYMSPEQLDPLEFGSQTAAVDTWSFGATLYFGLT